MVNQSGLASQRGVDEIVLVHGTFGRGILLRRKEALWSQAGSPLRSMLTSVFPQSTVVIPFNWSGCNSSRARVVASERLSKRLDDLTREYPGANVHFVAHSHGGNIAMYCLRERPSRVVSLICLSTPFLHVRER